jgi:hypothetical protein
MGTKTVTEATPWSARCYRDDTFGALPRGTFLEVRSVRMSFKHARLVTGVSWRFRVQNAMKPLSSVVLTLNKTLPLTKRGVSHSST